MNITKERILTEDDSYINMNTATLIWNVITKKKIYNIKSITSDLSSYDAVFIGFPVWAFSPPDGIEDLFKNIKNDLASTQIYVYVVGLLYIYMYFS